MSHFLKEDIQKIINNKQLNESADDYVKFSSYSLDLLNDAINKNKKERDAVASAVRAVHSVQSDIKKRIINIDNLEDLVYEKDWFNSAIHSITTAIKSVDQTALKFGIESDQTKYQIKTATAAIKKAEALIPR